MTTTTPSSGSHLVLLLIHLLASYLSGVGGYSVEAPAEYTALQGHLTAVVFLTATPTPTEQPLYTWDYENKTAIIRNTSHLQDDKEGKEEEKEEKEEEEEERGREEKVGEVDFPYDDDPEYNLVVPSGGSLPSSLSPSSPLSPPHLSPSSSTTVFMEPLKLSLWAAGSPRPIKTYLVAEDVDKLTYVFPCGLVVQGGVHFFRLQRGSQVMAESRQVIVQWPVVTIEVPQQLETYRTPVHVALRFTTNMCLPQSSVTFRTWVDLLYHGVPVGSHFHTTPTPSPAPDPAPAPAVERKPLPTLRPMPPASIGNRGRSRNRNRILRPWHRRRKGKIDPDDRNRRGLLGGKGKNGKDGGKGRRNNTRIMRKHRPRKTPKRQGRNRTSRKNNRRNKKNRRKDILTPLPTSTEEGGTFATEIPEEDNFTTESTETEGRSTESPRSSSEESGGWDINPTQSPDFETLIPEILGKEEVITETSDFGETLTTEIPDLEEETLPTDRSDLEETVPTENTKLEKVTTEPSDTDNLSKAISKWETMVTGTPPWEYDTIGNLERDRRSPEPSRGSVVSYGGRIGGSAWGGDAVLLGRIPLPGLYTDASHEVHFPCDAMGPAGLYSVRLATDVSSSPIIATSRWFNVVWSDFFSLYVHAASIVPCRGSVGVRVSHPPCVGVSDKVRVYARVRANVTSANPPTLEKYISERRIIQGRTSATFPCSTFDEEATDFCFVYINTARTGAVSKVVSKCVPTFKPHVVRERGSWGGWSSWTSCTSTCGIGQRLRHRFCDSPPPRNGGPFCEGKPLDSVVCEGPPCEEEEEEQRPPPASTPGGDACECGCSLTLPSAHTATITASAAECTGTATWLIQAPEGEHVVAEVAWANLHPGAQWLKLRDGDSLSSPLLVRLPSAASSEDDDDLAPSPRRLPHAPRQASSGTMLLLEFRSDVNSTGVPGHNPASWGFLVSVFPSDKDGMDAGVVVGRSGHSSTYSGLLAGMHIAAVVFVVFLVVAVIFLAVYNWRHYHLYKRARLIPESPYMTPPDTPSKEVATASSTLTLTEVISLKSLVMKPKLPLSLPMKRRSSSASYSPLDEDPPEDVPHHSLPNSPFLTRRVMTPSTLRRSSSQLGKILRKGSGTFKKKKRRFASVDELETRCISPIHEIQKEEDGEGAKENQAKEDGKEVNLKGEEDSPKYREYRKSLLPTEGKDIRLLPKFTKDKMNLERIRRSALSRSTSNATMRASSSVSELSVNGTDTEMEYDYYDYDMDNASAVPGSIFGLDPLLLAWVPPFIPMSEDESAHDGIPLDVLNLSETAPTTTPTAEEPSRPNVLPLRHLNIPNDQGMETSIRSEEANDRPELLQNSDPIESDDSPNKEGANGVGDGDNDEDDDDDDDLTPTVHSESKILNLDDFQFADDSDESVGNAL